MKVIMKHSRTVFQNPVWKQYGRIGLFLAVYFIFEMSPVLAQTMPEYHNISTEYSKTVSLNYLLYSPPNYRPNESWPLLLFLTGLEGVNDIDSIRQYGPPKAVEAGMNYNYFIAAPQLPGDVHWDPDALNALVSEIRRLYNIDDTKCYITGIGDRGGWGVYEFCVSYPGLFRKLVPIGATACTEICRIGNASTWIFHGKQDKIVPVEDAQNMQYELGYYCEKECKLTAYEDLGHEVWKRAYAEDSLWIWLFGSAPSYGTASPRPAVKSVTATITKEIDDDYLLYLPKDYSSTDKNWPLMVFLHGSGSAIQNIDDIRQAGPPMLFEQGRDNDFVLVCPQLYADVHWDVDRLTVLTQFIIDSYKIDRRRIYLTGLSRGGFGTWEFAVSYPDLFAAVVPISARDVPGVERLVNSNVWIFHGALDNGVPWQGSRCMYERLAAVGTNVQLTLFSGVGHWAWTPAYAMDSLWTWILSQENKQVSTLNNPGPKTKFDLGRNYPNPFNASTSIRYSLPAEANISLTIYDLWGREVNVLVNNRQPAGSHEIIWQSDDKFGNLVGSGMYFYSIRVNGLQQVKKCLLIK
ncbi:MAG: T9SS type A sorting domain-containing protein [Candidatus Neomarinimicrobiota bacterium]